MRASSSCADMAERSSPRTVSRFRLPRREFVEIDGHGAFLGFAALCALILAYTDTQRKENRAMTLPKTMTAIAIERARWSNASVPAEIAVPTPGPGQILIKVGRRRQPRRYAPGRGPPSAAARRAATPGSRGLRHRRCARLRRFADGRSAMRSARCFPAAAMPNTRSRPSRAACPFRRACALTDAGGLPEVYFTVWSNVFDTRAAEAGRKLSRPWRIERHRHRRDPAHGSARPPRVHDRGQRGEMRGLRQARRRARRSTIGPRISSRSSRPRPTAKASTSSSTWSAATM